MVHGGVICNRVCNCAVRVEDLWTDRYALFADSKQKFDTLEAEVSNLESNLHKVDG